MLNPQASWFGKDINSAPAYPGPLGILQGASAWGACDVFKKVDEFENSPVASWFIRQSKYGYIMIYLPYFLELYT